MQVGPAAARNRLTGLWSDGARLLDVGPLPAPQAVELGRAVGRERILGEPEPAEELAGNCAESTDGRSGVARCCLPPRSYPRPLAAAASDSARSAQDQPAAPRSMRR